jgi:flagellar assembly protein FliH
MSETPRGTLGVSAATAGIDPRDGAPPSTRAGAGAALDHAEALARRSRPPSPRISLIPEPDPLEPVVHQLRTRVAELEADLARVEARTETELLRLALAIARRVVGRELTSDRALVVAWTREALAALDRGEVVVVAAAPDVAALAGEASPEHPVEVDESLAPSAVELRGATRVVEASAEARLDVVVEHVGAALRGREAA